MSAGIYGRQTVSADGQRGKRDVATPPASVPVLNEVAPFLNVIVSALVEKVSAANGFSVAVSVTDPPYGLLDAGTAVSARVRRDL